MWRLIYSPAKGKNRSPYDEIILFGNPLAAKVFNKLENNSLKENCREWGGTIEHFRNKKRNYKWLQWKWKNVRIHFYEDYDNNNLVILNAFLKKSKETKTKYINITIDNFTYYESTK